MNFRMAPIAGWKFVSRRLRVEQVPGSRRKEVSMKSPGKFGLAVLFLTFAASLLLVPEFPATAVQQTSGMDHSAQPAGEPTPAFHAKPPQDALPPTMAPSMFNEIQTSNAYLTAGHIKKVLYQQPCYCHCDRSQGHGSLLDCYVSRHATGCDICQREDFYAYEQTHKGKTPAQIREGIMRGEWQAVDMAKYTKGLLELPNTPR
jgi:hypothetical protein